MPLEPPATSRGTQGPASAAASAPAGTPFVDPRSVLRRHGIRPRKSLGQHFLVDRGAMERIVAAAALGQEDVVLEIGAGLGVLTQALASRARRVVAVEIDGQLCDLLRTELAACANVRVEHADILALDPAAACGLPAQPAGTRRGFKVVGNLPYYITSAVMRRLLSMPVRPELAVLTVQAEVGARLLAVPPRMSLLAVSVQLYAEPSLVAPIPAEAFYPPPQVDSNVLRLAVRETPAVVLPAGGEAAFFRVVKAGFGQRRKQLRNSLSAGLGLPSQQVSSILTAAGIDAHRRPETLTLEEWSRLALVLTRGS